MQALGVTMPSTMAVPAMAELPCATSFSGLSRTPSWSSSRSVGGRVATRQPPRVHSKSVLRARSELKGKSGSEESRAVLDAFFLGKAVAEAVADRLSTAFGEILSDVGRLQAEQQKSLRKFQEDVQERAKKAIVDEARDSGRGALKNASTSSDTGKVNGVYDLE